ncbi:MAG: GTP cyclohydrolase II [Hyphomicrobiaceae bacterium]
MDKPDHIVLTSHRPSGAVYPLKWGAESAELRGPVVGGLGGSSARNVIGVHSGSYGVYRALAVAAGSLDPIHRPDLTNTDPTDDIGPFAQWQDPDRIVSLDPYGHLVARSFSDAITDGAAIQPTIAVTKARINLGELKEAVIAKRLEPDGKVLLDNGDVNVTKAAIEPVWYLPGIAKRLGVAEPDLRRSLFEQTGGMFPELITRSDLKIFLPPIGGISIYAFGDISAIWDPARKLACRVHDECNGSDVFGSDICTCRPYLTHGIEECIRMAQDGGAGLVVYNRKEGRALGEVTKFLVYNARKRQPAGDSAATYFERTECVAGVQDNRFQTLMPDVFHWLGVTRIDRFMSMSDMKYDALVEQGIEIAERVPIPDELIPPDAHVEMDAKKAAGYFVDERAASAPVENDKAKGRALDEY